MVSIIVPFKNAERVIDKCISSVIDQEYQEWELILVDNNSDDKSCDVCMNYTRRYKNISLIHEKSKECRRQEISE